MDMAVLGDEEKKRIYGGSGAEILGILGIMYLLKFTSFYKKLKEARIFKSTYTLGAFGVVSGALCYCFSLEIFLVFVIFTLLLFYKLG